MAVLAQPSPPPGLVSPQLGPSHSRPIPTSLARLIMSHRRPSPNPGPSKLPSLVHSSLTTTTTAAAADATLTLAQLRTSLVAKLPKRSAFAIREDVLLPLLQEKVRWIIDKRPRAEEDVETDVLTAILAALAIDEPYRSRSTAHPYLPVFSSLLHDVASALSHDGTPPSAALCAVRTALFALVASSTADDHYHTLVASTPSQLLSACSSFSLLGADIKSSTGRTALPQPSSIVTGKAQASPSTSDLSSLLDQAANRTLSMAEQRRLRLSLARHTRGEVMRLLSEGGSGGGRRGSGGDGGREEERGQARGKLVDIVAHNSLLVLGLLENLASRPSVPSSPSSAPAAPSSLRKGKEDEEEILLQEVLQQLVHLPPTSRSYDLLSRLVALPSPSRPNPASSSGDEGRARQTDLAPFVRAKILTPFLSNALAQLEKIEERCRGEAILELSAGRVGNVRGAQGPGVGGGRDRDRDRDSDREGDGDGVGAADEDEDGERALEAEVSRRMGRQVEAFAAFVRAMVGRGALRLDVGRGGEGGGGGGAEGEKQGFGDAQTGKEHKVELQEAREAEDPPWIIYELKAWALRNARVREASRLFSLLC